MSEVIINFYPEFEQALLQDIKIMTSRTESKGQPNDTFTAFGSRFKIIYVRQEKLGNVADWYWREEGCVSRGVFVSTWGRIHPNKGFDTEQVVWLHRFTRVR